MDDYFRLRGNSPVLGIFGACVYSQAVARRSSQGRCIVWLGRTPLLRPTVAAYHGGQGG